MLGFLPQKRDFRWLYWGIAYLIVVWGCLVLNRYIVLGSSLEIVMMLRLMLLAGIIAGIVKPGRLSRRTLDMARLNSRDRLRPDAHDDQCQQQHRMGRSGQLPLLPDAVSLRHRSGDYRRVPRRPGQAYAQVKLVP